MFELSSKFKNASNLKTASIYFIVVIKKGENPSDWIYLSQRKKSIQAEDGTQVRTQDKNITVGNISQSVNLFDKTLSTSMVGIELNNESLGYKNFTDEFKDVEFISLPVDIHFANDASDESIEDCPKVFSGYIREYSVNSDKVNFEIEDYSQYILSKRDFPKRSNENIALETIDDSVNTLYPVVYGHNFKSKLLFSRPNLNTQESRIYADATNDGIQILGYQDIADPLKIFRDKVYLTVPKTFKNVPDDMIINGYNYSKYNGETQYDIDGGDIVITKEISDVQYTQNMPLNLAARDQFQVEAIRTASGASAASSQGVLNYGAGDEDVTVEYVGGADLLDVGQSGNIFSFPAPRPDDVTIYAGYYENIVIGNFFRRVYELDSYYEIYYGAGGEEWTEDSGTFWLLNYYLQMGDDYGGTGLRGAVDFYKQIENPSDIIPYLNLPEGYSSATWIQQRYRSNPDWSFGEGGWHDFYYPSYGGMPDGVIDYGWDMRNKTALHGNSYGYVENLHPILSYDRPSSIWDGGLFPLHICDYMRYYGIKFSNGNEDEDISILFDDPIDNNINDMGDEWNHYYAENKQEAVPNILGLSGQKIERPPWTDDDNNFPYNPPEERMILNNEELLNTSPLSDYMIEGSMNWLEDNETPTLRKLLWGRRITQDEANQTLLSRGTWVYGILPVLGYSKPKLKSYHRGNTDGSGFYGTYDIVFDSLYCFGNPMFHGADGQDTWSEQGEYPAIDRLNKLEIEATPNQANNFQGFMPGLHYDDGSDFGAYVAYVYSQHMPGDNFLGQAMIRHPRVESRGFDAVLGGKWAGISYTEGLHKAAKIDLTFNSVRGTDVVQGATLSKLKGKIELDAFSTSDANNEEQLDLLVECNAFKPWGGRNNLIKYENFQTVEPSNVETEQYIYDEDGNQTINPNHDEPGELIKLSTGHAGEEPEGSEYTFATDLSIDIDTGEGTLESESPDTIFSECDVNAVTPEMIAFDPSHYVDDWRENVNAVNGLSVTFYVGRDMPQNDFKQDDNDFYTNELKDGFPEKISNTKNAKIRTRLINFELHQRYIVGNISQHDYYADVKGRIDTFEASEPFIEDNSGDTVVVGDYTGKTLNINSVGDDWLIRNPADILLHIMDKELDYSLSETGVDESSLSIARQNHDSWLFDFTVSEKINSQDFFKAFCQSTLFVPKINHDGTFGFVNFLKDYNADITIQSEDVINFEYSKTRREDLYLKVKVDYDYDEGLKKYQGSTDPSYGGAIPGEYVDENGQVQDALLQHLQMYKIARVDDNYLEVKSKFIKDSATAIYLRDYLLSFHKHRHNVIECTLPHKYLNLECGDIVNFDSLIKGLTMFGKDYTQTYKLAGQDILPLFLVQSVSKTTSNIKINLIQLHKFDSNVISSGLQPLSAPAFFPEETQYVLGDVNLDGSVDVLDIVAMTQAVVSSPGSVPASALPNADMNQDGSIDILDIVQIVGQVIGE